MIKKLLSLLLASILCGQAQASLEQVPGPVYGNQAGVVPVTGFIGEPQSNSTTNTAITSGTTVNATSKSIPAGNWICYSAVLFVPASTTVVAQPAAGITTTSATLPALPASTYLGVTLATGASGDTTLVNIPTIFNFTTATTVYVVAEAASVTTSTASVSGYLTCLRYS